MVQVADVLTIDGVVGAVGRRRLTTGIFSNANAGQRQCGRHYGPRRQPSRCAPPVAIFPAVTFTQGNAGTDRGNRRPGALTMDGGGISAVIGSIAGNGASGNARRRPGASGRL